MASTVSINGKIQISNEAGQVQINRAVSLSPTGTKYLYNTQSIGTAAEVLAVNDMGSLRYLGLQLGSTQSATVTVTMGAIVLKPGDVAVFPPGSTAVTLQATGDTTDVWACGTEA